MGERSQAQQALLLTGRASNSRRFRVSREVIPDEEQEGGRARTACWNWSELEPSVSRLEAVVRVVLRVL